jgi:hypothetical protein
MSVDINGHSFLIKGFPFPQALLLEFLQLDLNESVGQQVLDLYPQLEQHL